MRLPTESCESDYVNASYLGAATTPSAVASSGNCNSSRRSRRRESILNNPALSLASMGPGYIAAQVLFIHSVSDLFVMEPFCSKYQLIIRISKFNQGVKKLEVRSRKYSPEQNFCRESW